MPPTSEIADVVKILSSLGAVGFLGWLLLHLFKVEIPRRDAQYNTMLKSSTDAFNETLCEQRSEFREELKAQRQEFREELAALRGEHEHSTDRLADALERLTTTIQQNERS